jgi:LuxR family maltose regulon positive regulatory protein
MPQVPLLQTKLYVPSVWPELVSRPRLMARLDAGLGRRLTLVSAPAGFGKTTLLSEWVACCDCPVAWFSLDESDNDPTRFLAYLATALSRVEGVKATIGGAALGMLQSPRPPPAEAVLTPLINEIAALPHKILLVLDDYHLIEAQAVHDALTFLLAHLSPHTSSGGQCQGLHLVIASREDLQLPLARLRARGQLTELRAADLRFTSSEAAEFLNRAMGLGLSAEDIAALEARTEGWIAGLQLAAISLQGRKNVTAFIQSFTGSHRFVLDYLIEEVLELQSESVQDFLLQTVVLDRLTGDLCDALTGRDDGRATLEGLERANLFLVPLDEERRWYRYHRLFADLLRQRLRRRHPDWVPTSHLRASRWYEKERFVDEAIEHALRAGDFRRAAGLIARVAETVWVRGDGTKLRRWLDGLPQELVFSKPALCVFYAWSLFAAGQQGAAEQSLQAAERALEPGTDGAPETAPLAQSQLSGSDREKLRGRIAATRAFFAFYRGDVPAISRYARRALEYLPAQDLAWRSAATNVLGDAYDFKGEMAAAYRARLEALEVSRAAGNSYQIMIANLKLAIVLRRQGRLQRVIEICRQQMQMAREHGMSQTVVAGWLLAIWGEVLAELNDLDRAVQRARKGVELCERGGDLAMLGWSYLCLTRVLFSRGELTEAAEIVHKLEHTAREYDVPPWITNLRAVWQARLWLAQGRLEAAFQWAQERGLDAAGASTYLHEMEHIVLARILMAQGRLDEATGLLQRLLGAAEAGRRTTRMIEILALQALAFQTGGKPTQAMNALERALTLAEPGGFLRIFVDEGRPMARLLHQAAARGVAPDYARRLLAAFPVAEPKQAAPSKAQVLGSELVEPLSEREIEVLQLIAEGLTNREIAARLFLSLNTVKAHTRNIYGKLGVHSRTQAVGRAQALGILPSI